MCVIKASANKVIKLTCMPMSDDFKDLPDIRDGLNRKERAILYCLHKTQQELNNRNVPTAMLYGRVVELVDISPAEFQSILSRMVGLTRDTHIDK